MFRVCARKLPQPKPAVAHYREMLRLGLEEGFPTRVPGADWITPALAVGGRLSPHALGRGLCRANVGAVIDLREEDCDDEAQLRRKRIAFLHLPTSDHAAVTQSMLDRGVAFSRAHLGQTRVLIHCEHGIGRSACLALCVMVDGGYAPLDALTHMKDRRAVASPSPAQYEAWSEWLHRRDLAAPSFGEFCAIAYRHLV